MKLCVGAVSRIVVEEAARLEVCQIVASRRQCDIDGGYLDWTQDTLVEKVNDWSAGATLVVRDHGGPTSKYDIGYVLSLNADVAAGFDGLHLDVCKLDKIDQEHVLRALVARYNNSRTASNNAIHLEVGGERDNPGWLNRLLTIAAQEGVNGYGVIPLGGHIWNDHQRGYLHRPSLARAITTHYRTEYGLKTKAHNMDWVPNRRDYDAVDAVNVAPEFSLIETRAWLDILPARVGVQLLEAGYAGGGWLNWFKSNEGTRHDRAMCGVRYVMETPDVRRLLEPYRDHEEALVRKVVRGAIARG